MASTVEPSYSNYDRYIKQVLASGVNKCDIDCYNNLRCSPFAKPLTDIVFVFDLDLTAICTQDSVNSLHSLGIYSNPRLLELRKRVYYFNIEDLEKKGIGTKYNFWGVTRPHLYDLLRFCIKHGRIVIWSAGKRPYVEAIVSYIFKNLPYPELVLTHDDIAFDKDGNVVKALTKVSERLKVPLSKILVIDDNELTFQQNVGNGVLVPAYEPGGTIAELMEDDQSLIKLKQWLSTPGIMTAPDVTVLDKTYIFT
jgi:hypothetical protein